MSLMKSDTTDEKLQPEVLYDSQHRLFTMPPAVVCYASVARWSMKGHSAQRPD
ncbi:hypothetical protein BAUCODRAFT_35442 [Baudoinia panamericana UAMH 10762]|uniref:Uncharacterized protein n=1 Tax=Baudoinia panamericana (strain UAMH 10762) TaxID=717646 RepID=M2LMC2_BAUPA|nr:uncharacterized protein BAUCODRAFT_35442 [Baudoinia panamericana UAMH 10762]EMC95462.1 hypothetical protein BAUCODRAFT_35442 [Baudoinia panamericana UAMH 10762]